MDYEDADPAAGHYNDSNRAFLQAFIARTTLTVAEGKKLLAAIFTAQEGKPTSEDEVTQEDLDSYISAAADAISPFDYEIRSTQHQIIKKRTYALVNSSSDALTQFATIKTPEEIEYMKRFLDAMFDTYNKQSKEIMAVSGMQAMQTALRKGVGRQSVGEESQSIDKGLTNEQVEKLLLRLCKEFWLERSRAGYYSLAPRALMELRSWLVDTYNDVDEPEEWQRIKFCEACKEIITVGQRCSQRECNVRLHNICEAAYFNSKNPPKKCPKCRTAWSGTKFVGEKVITTTEDYLKGKRRSGGNKRAREEEDAVEDEVEESSRHKKSGRNFQAQDEHSDDDEDDEEEEEEQRAESHATRRKEQASQREVFEDGEEDEDADD